VGRVQSFWTFGQFLGDFWASFLAFATRLPVELRRSHCPVALCFHLVTPLADSP
jgi:hypothetical protein